MSCLKTYISILYCCNCWYNYECIFVIAPWGTLIGIKILYCIVLYWYSASVRVKGTMSLGLVIFWKVFFTLKENIYLQNMSIKRVFFLCVFAACLPASLIMYIPISELHAQWHQHEFELSNVSFNSIQRSCWIGGLCYFLFYYNSPKLLSCFFF